MCWAASSSLSKLKTTNVLESGRALVNHNLWSNVVRGKTEWAFRICKATAGLFITGIIKSTRDVLIRFLSDWKCPCLFCSLQSKAWRWEACRWYRSRTTRLCHTTDAAHVKPEGSDDAPMPQRFVWKLLTWTMLIKCFVMQLCCLWAHCAYCVWGETADVNKQLLFLLTCAQTFSLFRFICFSFHTVEKKQCAFPSLIFKLSSVVNIAFAELFSNMISFSTFLLV